MHAITQTSVSGFTSEVLDALPKGVSIPMEYVVRLIREVEERALRAEKNAEIICSKAIDAVRAAQLRAEEAEARARQLAQHAARHIKLLHARVVAAEASPDEWTERTEISPFVRSQANANEGRPFGRLQ